jgi:hypothetical protein
MATEHPWLQPLHSQKTPKNLGPTADTKGLAFYRPRAREFRMRILSMVAAILLGGTSLAFSQADAPPPAPAADEVPPPPPEPAPPIVADTVKYFIAVNGQTTGPFTIEEIKAKIADGSVKGLTMMWKKGQANWEPAEKLPEIKLAIDETPKPAPFDCVSFATGTWQKTTMFNGQTVTLVTRFESNGQFVSVQTMAGLPGNNSYGSWNATAVGEKSCSISMNIQYPSTTAVTGIYDIVSQTMLSDKSDGSQIVRLQ